MSSTSTDSSREHLEESVDRIFLDPFALSTV